MTHRPDDVLDETDAAAEADDGNEDAEDAGYADDDDDAHDDDADHFLLDEDSEAPNLVPEEHPRSLLSGKIEMLDKIGEGGMGAVWRGHHLNLDRAVAVKVLDETLQLRTDGRERFIREAKALALLDHRNVVRIYDCDQTPDGKLFLCMEHLEGETLRALIKRGVRPDPLEVIDIGLQICGGVEAAHRRGILHRDLTPSNIMRLRDSVGTIKVIDWGLCKYLDLFYMRGPQKYGAPPGARLVTPLGCRFGTPEYMAPEMIARENPGPPSFCTDVYALGVVLYELLTGRHPFAFGNRKQPRPIQTFLPGFDYHDLETALQDALRYDPEARTPSMVELREALDMARACLLAQRADAAKLSADQPAITPSPAAPDTAAEAPGDQPAIQPVLTVSDAAAPAAPAVLAAAPDVGTPVQAETCEIRAAPAPAVPRRRRLATAALMLIIGAGAGAGGVLVAQRLADSGDDDIAEPSRHPLAATLALDRARASAAELRAARCEADAASRSVARDVVTPPPSSPPPDQASGTGAPPAVLAAAADPSAVTTTRPRSPSRPGTSISASRAVTFEAAMARLEPKIRGCAREAGAPELPTTVQVRRKAGAFDMVKVVRLSREHPFSVCVDRVIRQATLPASAEAVEDFTFFR